MISSFVLLDRLNHFMRVSVIGHCAFFGELQINGFRSLLVLPRFRVGQVKLRIAASPSRPDMWAAKKVFPPHSVAVHDQVDRPVIAV